MYRILQWFIINAQIGDEEDFGDFVEKCEVESNDKDDSEPLEKELLVFEFIHNHSRHKTEHDYIGRRLI